MLIPNSKDLKDYSVAVPLHLTIAIFEKIKVNNNSVNFTELKDYSILPPPALFNSIKQKIIFTNKKLVPGKIIIFRTVLKVAAAAILIVGGIYFYILKTTLNSLEKTPSVATNVSKNNSVPTQQNDIIGKAVPITPIAAKPAVDQLKAKIVHKQIEIRSIPAKASQMLMDIDGTTYTFLDNDLLASFAFFDPNKVPSFLLRENKEFTLVTVDNFTAVNISPGMATILQRMYKVKKNGKPSRIASKQQKKLLQWKNADRNYFDLDIINNPLNPIDLGNLILNK